MATRALLLCGDEKAVLAITQILDELEISFEHSNEPPFALKRLAARHFDLLIVDCDNVQNATQVFNSARSSNLNKASIAIAIVEGKAGVPSAFRLGASLVLTKPVSLEQARNTLRTGVGMTRKDVPETKAPVVPATPAVPAAFTPAPVAPPAPVASVPAAPATTPVAPVSTAVEKAPVPATPAVLTSAVSATIAPKTPEVAKTKEPEAPKVEKIPAPTALNVKPIPSRPTPVDTKSSDEYKPALTNFTDEESVPVKAMPNLAKGAAATAGAPVETSKFDSVFAGPGSATCAEKSKVGSGKTAVDEGASKKDETSAPVLRIEDPLADDDSVLDPIRDNGVPSFGTMSHQSFAGLQTKESKGKGMLVAGLVVLLFGAAGYAAWLTQPAFRDILTFEYHEVASKIAEWRGHPQGKEIATPKTVSVPPVPPAPAPLPDASQQLASTTPADPSAQQSPTPATSTDPNASSNPPAAGATSTTSPTEGPAQVSKATASATPQKGASLQPAKQDTTAGHSSTSPAVIPAAANLPPTTKKSTASDLIEVPEDFADDQIIHRVHPTYPKQARAKKLHGTVVLQAVVNKQGKVDSLQLVSGDAQLAQAAAEAVKQWRYKPYFRNGDPVDFQTRVTVDFKMP
jgi:protein TonB